MDCITLTGNLLAEWTLYVDSVHSGKTQRATDESFQVGGKGINVSKMLNRFEIKNTAVFFANGHLADFCESWLWSKSISTRRFPLASDTRVGFISKLPTDEETTVLGKDKPIPLSSWREALNWIKRQNPDCMVIAGSLPGWTSDHFQVLSNFMKDSTIQVFLDTYGPPLRDIVQLPCKWIKINRQELNSLSDELETLNDKAVIAWLLSHPSGANWIITNGAKPVIVVSKDYQAIVKPATVEEASPTGSGDVTMAALISEILNGKSTAEAVSFAFACGTANANENTIAEFDLPPGREFYPR